MEEKSAGETAAGRLQAQLGRSRKEKVDEKICAGGTVRLAELQFSRRMIGIAELCNTIGRGRPSSSQSAVQVMPITFSSIR